MIDRDHVAPWAEADAGGYFCPATPDRVLKSSVILQPEVRLSGEALGDAVLKTPLCIGERKDRGTVLN